MYLTKAVIENSGPTNRLALAPVFESDGRPRPIVIVGANGSGKTNFLSTIADAMLEIASLAFTDVLPRDGAGNRKYYRLLGGATTRAGGKHELAVAKFRTEGGDLFYGARVGALPEGALGDDWKPLLNAGGWKKEQNAKVAVGDKALVEAEFRDGAYVFFPSNRSETPHWAVEGRVEAVEQAGFEAQVKNYLRRPVVVSAGMSEMLPWLIDILLDASVDPTLIHSESDVESIRRKSMLSSLNLQSVTNFNHIVKTVMGVPGARLVRVGRHARQRKLQIFDGDKALLPSLYGLSSGQSSLVTIFSTILRYGDAKFPPTPADKISGIVLIDEVDAHLHADLLFDKLPNLIKMFPRIQFIVSAHAPLFPLGMDRVFGEEGYTLVDFPTGHIISSQRYSEFVHSLSCLQETKLFEERVAGILARSARPIVLCEGETDPIYLKTAAELLGFSDVVAAVDFDWVGVRGASGAIDGGKESLGAAYKAAKNNPGMISPSKIFFVFDGDARRREENDGRLYVVNMPENPKNKKCTKGVENLLPASLFQEKFYTTTKKVTSSVVTTKMLKKIELCNYVCNEVRDVRHFSNFLSTLEKIRSGLIVDS